MEIKVLDSAESLNHHRGNIRCEFVGKLSAEQRAEIMKIKAASAQKMKALRSEIRVAKAELSKVLLASNSTKEEASAAEAALKSKLSQSASIQEAAKLDVLFDVLSPEQRIAKVECLQKSSVQRRGGSRGRHAGRMGRHHPGQHRRFPHPRHDRHPTPGRRGGPIHPEVVI